MRLFVRVADTVPASELKAGDKILTHHPCSGVAVVRSAVATTCNGVRAVKVTAYSGVQPWEFVFPATARVEVLE